MEMEVLNEDTFLGLLAGPQLTEYRSQDCAQRVRFPLLIHQKMQDGLFLGLSVSERLKE